MPNAIVCLPTYNERENLEAMLRALEPLGVRVLVIDDNSPDGTGEIADRLAAELDFVSVLHRERKEGLGPAYLAGFRRALDDGAELILEMDCDFSHDPKDVPRLIAACEAGADLALGSRYVPGGGTANWGIGRRIVSWGGSFYARLVLGVRIRDLTGGFKCYRRRVLETIDLDAIHSKGYAFQIEGTYRTLRKGFNGRRGADPVRRPDRGRVEDEPLDLPRGRRERAAASARGAERPAVRNGATIPRMRELEPATFDDAIARGAVVVDFWAPWCRPCLALEPVLEQIEARVPVARLNIDDYPEISARYEVLSIPTVMLFAGGEARGRVVGIRPLAHFEKLARRSAPSRRARRARRAGSRRRLSLPRSARSR